MEDEGVAVGLEGSSQKGKETQIMHVFSYVECMNQTQRRDYSKGRNRLGEAGWESHWHNEQSTMVHMHENVLLEPIL